MGNKDILQQAIYYENRQDTEQAAHYFSRLKNQIMELAPSDVMLVAKFYAKIRDYETAYDMTKLTLQAGADLYTTLPFYLQLVIEMNAKDIVFWRDLAMQIHPTMVQRDVLQLFQLLVANGDVHALYERTLQFQQNAEKYFFDTKDNVALFIGWTLLLVEIEVAREHFVQARFHLRKVMYLEGHFVEDWNPIMYWCVRLDEVALFIGRRDWVIIQSKLQPKLYYFGYIYDCLKAGKDTTEIVQSFAALQLADVALEKKREVLLQLLQKKRVEVNKHDLLSVLASGSHTVIQQSFMLHADKSEMIRAFWQVQPQKRKGDIQADVSIRFIGGAHKIGGTAILLTVNGHKLLLDAGMFLNEEPFHIDLKQIEKQLPEIDAVLLSHAHLDHSGSLPYLVKKRKLPIYMTKETRQLIDVLFLDLIARPTRPGVYNEQEITNVQDCIQEVEFENPFLIESGEASWRVTYFNAGHILGAASIYIEIYGVSILFTGDFSMQPQYTAPPNEVPTYLPVDIIISESTYGYLPMMKRYTRQQTEENLYKSVYETLVAGGNVLIPAFALGRAQEILRILTTRELPFPIVLDGRAQQMTEAYEKLMQINMLTDGQVYLANELENGLTEPHCVIASSGMLHDGSAATKYAFNWIEETQHKIIFTGYVDRTTPAYAILHSRKGETVRLNGQLKEIQATIENYSFSAHPSRDELLAYILKMQPKYAFLMHAEHEKRYEGKYTIAPGEVIYPSIQQLLKVVQQDVKVYLPVNGQSFDIK